MSRPYGIGVLIVACTVLASALACVTIARSADEQPPRAAQDLGSQSLPLGEFQLVERSGRPVSRSDLADRVWISSFIFTRCPLSCPRISSVMKGLQEKLRGTDVLLVSISVDPEHDTPAVLKGYAERFSADADRWWFLTGQKARIYGLIRQDFRLNLAEVPDAANIPGMESIAHSDRLALVDRGKVVGLFDSKDPAAINDLIVQGRLRACPAWVRSLPPVNASLNGICALLLLLGWFLIRSAPARTSGALLTPRVRGHIICMASAVGTSALFLACYLVYHSYARSVPFRGQGMIRVVYLSILLSHTLLATFGVVPLVGLTLYRALRRQFDRHARISSLTFPIWLYVSVTGVIIYLMLYQMPLQGSGAFLPGGVGG